MLSSSSPKVLLRTRKRWYCSSAQGMGSRGSVGVVVVRVGEGTVRVASSGEGGGLGVCASWG